jgi:hypothetical protein
LAVVATGLALLLLRAPDTSLGYAPEIPADGIHGYDDYWQVLCPDCMRHSSGPQPEPPPANTMQIEWFPGRSLDELRVSCISIPGGLDSFGPPPAQESLGARLGSELVAFSRSLGRPDARTRRLLEDLGATPATVGRWVAGTSPWLGLAALESERSWTGRDPWQERDRSEELPLALALQEQWPDHPVAQRAALYELEVRDIRAERREIQERALSLLHESDDPVVHAFAIIHLFGSDPPLTAADHDRLWEVVGGLPAQQGALLSALVSAAAWNAGDEAGAVAWWTEARAHADRCQTDCDCIASYASAFVPVLAHHGALELDTVEDRLRLAAARCQLSGIPTPTPITQEHPWSRVPADSRLGLCIQAELGDAPVLDRDLELVLTR